MNTTKTEIWTIEIIRKKNPYKVVRLKVFLTYTRPFYNIHNDFLLLHIIRVATLTI